LSCARAALELTMAADSRRSVRIRRGFIGRLYSASVAG
jgi:hypothetical protein